MSITHTAEHCRICKRLGVAIVKPGEKKRATSAIDRDLARSMLDAIKTSCSRIDQEWWNAPTDPLPLHCINLPGRLKLSRDGQKVRAVLIPNRGGGALDADLITDDDAAILRYLAGKRIDEPDAKQAVQELRTSGRADLLLA